MAVHVRSVPTASPHHHQPRYPQPKDRQRTLIVHLMRMHPASSPLIFEDQLIGTLPFHHAPPLGIFRVLEKRRLRSTSKASGRPRRIIDAFSTNAWSREMLRAKGPPPEGVVGLWLRDLSGHQRTGLLSGRATARGQAAWEIHWYMHPAAFFPFSWPGQSRKIIVSENLTCGCAMREDILRIFVEIIFLAKFFLFFSFFLSRERCKDVMEPSHDGQCRASFEENDNNGRPRGGKTPFWGDALRRWVVLDSHATGCTAKGIRTLSRFV